MIFDVEGNPVGGAFGVDGGSLAQAYDIDKNPLLGGTLVVMTYNYQWCTKINSQLQMQREIIAKYNPDIIGIQEAAYNNKNSNVFPSLASQFLGDYTRQLSTQATNRNGLASKIPYTDFTSVKYSENDDENWDYLKCYIEFGGERIAFFNTHLTWRHDAETYLRKYSQARELFQAVQQEEYAIITGDFNLYGDSLQSDDYIGIGKQFADAGYTMVNWTAETFVKTATGATTATSLADFQNACDCIIATPNIEIVRSFFDTTKLDYLDGNSIDHIPVVAEFRLVDA